MSENADLPNQSSMVRRLMLIAVPFVIMIVLIVLIQPTIKDVGVLLASYQWQSTEVRLLTVEVESIFITEVGEYRPNVRYSYSVDGVDYIGSRLYFGNEADNFLDWSLAADLAISPYAINQRVTAYYNPNAPSETVIERRFGAEYALQTGIFVAILLFIGAYIITLIRMTIAQITHRFQPKSATELSA